MQTAFRPRTLVLFVGDLAFFTLSLWLSLFLRVFQAPSQTLFFQHLIPFSLLFVAWVLVFFVAGLYESRLILFARRALSATLLTAQIINMIIAALFFFLVPLFGIAPKTLLGIYLIVSFLLVLFWRAVLFPWLGLAKPEAAVLVGEGGEVDELAQALRGAPRAPLRIVEVVAPDEPELSRAVVAAMERHRARVVIADFDEQKVSQAFPQMYNLLSVGVRFIDALTLYEDLFGRVPLSRLNTAWLARNINASARTLYDVFKRFMDIAIALPAGIISLIFYPFIITAIKLEDGGAVFIAQRRVGAGDRVIYIHKFRSMQRNDMELTTRASDNKITKVGAFIRKTRLDELPQLWDIVRGQLSFVGPRPELPSGVALYEKEIPYYGLRHLVKPGLSGWAQLYHHADAHHAADVVETRNKLSYDLYYLKHRSLWLDAVIALKTVRRVLLRGNA
jgi:exopolysaccharide biosynthesis polyprenyl glycosylphosphotransferase